MKKLILLITLIFMSTSMLSSKDNIVDANRFIDINFKSNNVQFENFETEFSVNTEIAKSILDNGQSKLTLNNFPLNNGESTNLILTKSKNVYTKDAKVISNTSKGKIYIDRSHYSFNGKVENELNSFVYLSATANGLTGFIQREDGTSYSISPGKFTTNKNKIHYITQTSLREIMDDAGINFCQTDEITAFDPSAIDLSKDKDAKIQKTELLHTRLAIDANFEYYLKFCQRVVNRPPNQWLDGESWYFTMSDAQKDQARELALEYAENVVALSSKIYEEQNFITISIVYLEMYEDPDSCPYFNDYFGANLGEKLNAMPSIWQLKDDVPPRTLATVFTDVDRQPSSSTTLGIARAGNNYSGVLCQTSSQAYSAIGLNARANFPRVAFATDVQVLAHELGHNFGCPHTHNCDLPSIDGGPVIDSCVSENFAGDAYCIRPQDRRPRNDGTIMSYCHIGGGIVFDFHPRMKSRIRNHAENAPCLTEYPDPIVKLTRPLGQELFLSGDTENITFASANVPSIRILYSSNGGNNWEEITTVNASEVDEYEWQIPNEATNTAKIRIEDASNDEVYDESILNFRISKVSVSELYPQNGDEVGYLQEANIRWNKTNVDNVNVKYSTDDGNSFITIAENTNASSVSYNFPDEEVQNAILLIESSENSQVNTLVNFSIGKETVEFVYPDIADMVCLNKDTFMIAFRRHFVEDFDLEVSFNEGADWSTLTNFANKIDPVNNNFTWLLDTEEIQEGDEARLRAVLKDQNNTVIGIQTDDFVFVGGDCLLGSVRKETNKFRINTISPNPARENINIQLFNGLGKIVPLKLEIRDMSGNIVQSIENKYLSNGFIEINLSTEKLFSGTYFISVEAAGYGDSYQVKVIK